MAESVAVESHLAKKEGEGSIEDRDLRFFIDADSRIWILNSSSL